MKRALRATLVLGLCAGLGVALVWAILQLTPAPVQLPAKVGEEIDASGVSHPVTAVLLNFRGYDTLLEVAVLLLALLGVLAGTSVEQRRPVRQPAPRMLLLSAFARLLVPLIILVAGYLLWAGSHRPGGAFQAAAVLAASGVLLHLAHLMPAWATPRRALRFGLVVGFMVFLTIAALPVLIFGGSLLQYPQAAAGSLILLIEAGLSLSLGLVLAGLFLLLSDHGVEFDR